MSSVVELDPDTHAVRALVSQQEKPRPLNSLTAAATRLKGKDVVRKGYSQKTGQDAWQEDAWDMYDLVGEQRFLASTLANRMSQARFFVGKMPSNPTEEVVPLTDGPAHEAFDAVQGKGANFPQIIQRLGVNLFIPGDGYVVGHPEKPRKKTQEQSIEQGIDPFAGVAAEEDSDEIDITKLIWCMRARSEVSVDEDQQTATVNGQTFELDEMFLIDIWRPHPKNWKESDSPTRSSLPILRELVGLTMHISAQVDSRLAGAGILFVPASADVALRAQGQVVNLEDPSPFSEALMDAMIKAIEDRSNASALVPLMPVVPDESIEKFKYLSLASDLSMEARELREEAIRRLALGQDCPPELLLGVSGMNHWGAWLVREDVVTTHLEPPLALICDALTTQFLWPVLEAGGMSEEETHDYVIWYDVDHLIMRPNRGDDAKWARENDLISDESTRDALGFDESDAPPVDPSDEVTKLLLTMIRDAPTLAQNPGLAVLNEQVRAMLEGKPIPTAPEVKEEAPEAGESGPETAEEPSTEGGVPATAEQPAEEPTEENP